MTVSERQEFKQMIEYEVGCQLPQNPRFFNDLGIGGDDCIQLMNRIATKYGIDMTSYIPSEYHETEQEILSTGWPFDVKLNRVLKEFDLNHLIEVIDKKRWYEPD